MPFQRVQRLPRFHVPGLQRAVLAGRDQRLAVGGKDQRQDRTRVTGKRPARLLGGEIPDTHGLVQPGGGK